MTLRFAPLSVALPPGCSGVRVDVMEVAPLVAMMPAGDWPESMRDAADSRRADYLAGRLAAREAVRLATGRDARIGRADDGSPCWPDGIEGSISHYGGVAAAVARRVGKADPVGLAQRVGKADPVGLAGETRGGIGIDIAPLLEGDRLRAVMRRCLTDNERSAQPSEAAVSLTFAAKEALFKAAHPRAQRFIGFDEAEISVVGAPSRPSVPPSGHLVTASGQRTGSGAKDGTASGQRTGSGGWSAVLADDLARLLGVATVYGTYAWEHGLVYAVVAID